MAIKIFKKIENSKEIYHKIKIFTINDINIIKREYFQVIIDYFLAKTIENNIKFI